MLLDSLNGHQQTLLLNLPNLPPLAVMHNGIHKHLCAYFLLLLQFFYWKHPFVDNL